MFRGEPLLGVLANKTQPISKGLVGSWLLNERAGSRILDSSGHGRHGNQPTLARQPNWGLNELGSMLDFPQTSSSEEYFELGDDFDIIGEGLTMVVWFTTRNVGACGGRLLSKSSGGSAADHFWMLNVCNDTIRTRIRAGGSTTTLASPAGIIAVSTPYMTAVTYDGTNIRLYINSTEASPQITSIRQVNSTAKTGTLNVDNSVSVMLGRNGDDADGGNHLDGIIDRAYLWERALSLRELEILQYDPFIMFRRSPIGRIYGVEAAGGTSLPFGNKMLSGKYPHLRM